MKESTIIRRMMKSDIEEISQAFIHQGWPGREDILTSYLQDQENGERDVLVAESDGFVAGYITILPYAKHGPFVGVYPELSDFNVFEPFRNRGIGNQLLEEAEKRVRLLSEIVTLGHCLVLYFLTPTGSQPNYSRCLRHRFRSFSTCPSLLPQETL